MNKRDFIEEADPRDRSDNLRYEGVVEALQEAIPALQAVYLFGSRARGQMHRESDVDLAVLSPRPLIPDVRWELQEELASGLHAEVDLIDLAAASTVLRMQVVTTGAVLYEKEPHARHQFEMLTLSAYALLNEERATLLEQIHQRGRIYGR